MKTLLLLWHVDGPSLLLLFLLAGVHFSQGGGRAGYLIAALLTGLLCFCSPLALLSAHYLFSAHMTVHVLLLLCAGPLLLLSLSPRSGRFAALFGFVQQHPVTGWLCGVGIMWLWHLPALFNHAMSSAHEGWSLPHLAEKASLLGAGLLFSAPVLHPNPRFRIGPLPAVLYLFTACIGCSVLGLLITFAPPGTYRFFLSGHDSAGLNAVILQQWGLTQAIDQQAAGLIMWVPCCLLYVSGAMYLLLRWLRQKEETQLPEASAVPVQTDK